MHELNHLNGKGDKNRSDADKLRERWPEGLTGNVEGFVRQGPSRLRKVYRAASPRCEEPTKTPEDRLVASLVRGLLYHEPAAAPEP